MNPPTVLARAPSQLSWSFELVSPSLLFLDANCSTVAEREKGSNEKSNEQFTVEVRKVPTAGLCIIPLREVITNRSKDVFPALYCEWNEDRHNLPSYLVSTLQKVQFDTAAWLFIAEVRGAEHHHREVACDKQSPG